MLLLAKILALAVLVFFYREAKQQGLSGMTGVKWAVIGFVGYILTWFLVYKLLGMLPKGITRSMVSGFLVMQIPALCGALIAYFVRGKLIAEALKNPRAESE